MRSIPEVRDDLIRALTWSEIVSEDPACSGTPLYELTPERFSIYTEAMPRAFGQLARGEDVDPRLPIAGFDLVAEPGEWLLMAKISTMISIDDLRSERRRASLYDQVRSTAPMSTIDRERFPYAAEHHERRVREAKEERSVLDELTEDKKEALARLSQHPPGETNFGRRKAELPRLDKNDKDEGWQIADRPGLGGQIHTDDPHELTPGTDHRRVWRRLDFVQWVKEAWLIENAGGWSIGKWGRTGNPRGRPSRGQRKEEKVAVWLEGVTGLPIGELRQRLGEQNIRDQLHDALNDKSVNVATVAKVLNCHRSTVYRLRAT